MIYTTLDMACLRVAETDKSVQSGPRPYEHWETLPPGSIKFAQVLPEVRYRVQLGHVLP